jgi:hypothetical protein
LNRNGRYSKFIEDFLSEKPLYRFLKFIVGGPPLLPLEGVAKASTTVQRS